MLNTREILKRVGDIIGSQENKKIAEALKTKPTTCSNWKTRNAIPWEKLFAFVEKRTLSFYWLLTGKETDASACSAPNDTEELKSKYLQCCENLNTALMEIRELEKKRSPWNGKERRIKIVPPRED